MRKTRIKQNCVICSNEFEIRPCEVSVIVTCSKQCSLKHRSNCHKGRVITWADKISKSNIGKVKPNNNSPEARLKISNTLKQKYASGYVSPILGTKQTEERKEYIRKINLGHSRCGWKFSLDIRKKMSESKKGDKCHLWKGGVTKKSQMIRSSFEYREWRKSVFIRDDFTCQECNKRGGRLHVHHLKSFALFPELRLDIDNGQTLCIPCHKETETFLKR